MSDDRFPDPFRAAGPDDATSAGRAPSPAFAPVAPVTPAPLTTIDPPVRAKGSGMLLNALLGVALVVAVGGVAFAAGRVTAPAASDPVRSGFFPGGPTASGAPGGFTGGPGGTVGGVSLQGTVTAVTADSITIQLPSGQSMTIPTDAQTTYHQREAATATDVATGTEVIVQLQAGRGALNGNGGQGLGPNASGAPGRTLGPAGSITILPSGS